jgi:hypothetical protein
MRLRNAIVGPIVTSALVVTGVLAVTGALVVGGALAAPGFQVLSAQTAQAAKTPMSDADYAKAMKEIGPTFMSLQRANASMNHSQGEKDAQRLSDLFSSVQVYWEARKAVDAVGFAKSAVAAADATVKASAQMDMSALTASQQKLSAACSGCHMAHRDKLADGSYKIK